MTIGLKKHKFLHKGKAYYEDSGQFDGFYIAFELAKTTIMLLCQNRLWLLS